MFELIEINGEIKLVDERHYHLVAASDITADDLVSYRKLAKC